MNEIQRMQKFLQNAFSSARITLDKPLRKGGVWSMNVFLPDYHIAAAWQEGKGFGIVSNDTHGYGEGADEVYENLDIALPRVVQLLNYKLATAPPHSVPQGTPRRTRSFTRGNRSPSQKNTSFRIKNRGTFRCARVDLKGICTGTRWQAVCEN